MPVIVEGPGIARNEIYGLARRGKALQALAIRWGADYQGRGPHALSPTSTVSTTREAPTTKSFLVTLPYIPKDKLSASPVPNLLPTVSDFGS